MDVDLSFYDLLHNSVYNPSPYISIQDRNRINSRYDYDYIFQGSPQGGVTVQLNLHNMRRQSRNERERYPNYRY